MKKAMALIGLLTISTMARADFYVSLEKTPNSAPLWRIGNIATFYDGNQLYRLCTSSNNGDANFCSGYVAASADFLQNQNANYVCLPPNVVVGQLMDVVKKYLTDHPETRQYIAISEIEVALEKAFPCKAK
jgi:hypothetical protein